MHAFDNRIDGCHESMCVGNVKYGVVVAYAENHIVASDAVGLKCFVMRSNFGPRNPRDFDPNLDSASMTVDLLIR